MSIIVVVVEMWENVKRFSKELLESQKLFNGYVISTPISFFHNFLTVPQKCLMFNDINPNFRKSARRLSEINEFIKSEFVAKATNAVTKSERVTFKL